MIDHFFRLLAWLYGGGKDAAAVYREWHSFLIGFCEMVCFCIPARFPRTEHAVAEMEKEEHYYQAGRACGIIMYVIIILGVGARIILAVL